MPGDFSADFNSDFGRVAVSGALSAEITLSAALAGAHGAAGELTATIVIEAALAGAHYGAVFGDLATAVILVAEFAGVLPVTGELAGELQIIAEMRGPRARRRPAVGGGRRRVNFPVPLPPALPKEFQPPSIGRLAAPIVLAAAFTGEHAQPEIVPLPPPPIAAAAGGLAGLIFLEASLSGVVLPFDENEEEILLLLLAA